MAQLQGQVQELFGILRDLQRQRFRAADGFIWEGLLRPIGFETADYGFIVTVADDPNQITVGPSVVSGMGAWATIPKINDIEVTASPAPALIVTGKQWVALRMEIQPSGELVYKNDDTEVWGVMEAAGTLMGDVTVEAFASADAMESEARLAEVDRTDGTPTQSGIYVIPLALRVGDEWKQVGYTGPLGVRMCRSGAFVALSPARGPGVAIPT